MAKYYPVGLVLEGKKCLVVGAGSVAERKVRRLLECGAHVTVIGLTVTPALKALAKSKKIVFKKRKVSLKDLKRGSLVVAATTDRKINAALSSYCRKNDILINVVDSPKECSFILPSVVRRGALTISISTDGISPLLARKIREDLERRFGKEYAKLLKIMKEIRPQALKKIKDPKARRVFFQKALEPQILGLLRRHKDKQVKRKLEGILKNA